MKQVSLHILENTALAQGIYRLRLGGDVSAVTDPGQFVNIKLDGFFLRRPHLRVRLAGRRADADL